MAEAPWRPTASLAALGRRAEILGSIRAFFASRGVFEVETPILARAATTDVHLQSIVALHPEDGTPLYLQTSPEAAMKRLLSAGSGAIYQLGRAFRGGELGPRHNPEFTMLEWYRPGWTHLRLMDEVDELVGAILGTSPAERRTYAELFHPFGIDPHRAEAAELEAVAHREGIGAPALGDDREAWLQLLLSHLVEPSLGRERPTFVLDFPAPQAALARVRAGNPPVAERFELFVRGVELANGYHELTDPDEHRERFARNQEARRDRGLPVHPADVLLLEALDHGLPPCAGVALGVDRLVLLALGARRLDEVLAFPFDRA